MRNTLVYRILDRAKHDKNILLLTGDLGFGVLDTFAKELPDQFINCGIAEQNMLSVAAGLGISGKTVFVYSIGNFPTLRAMEQIRNDCCYHNANVKIISVGAGLSYGALGMSHHSTEDIAMMRALPSIRVFSPACASEMDAVLPEILQPGTAFIRLGKGGEAEVLHETSFEIGCPWAVSHIQKDAKVLILTMGSIVEEAVLAKQSLKEEGLMVDIATLPILKPLDEAKTVQFLLKYTAIVTLEEHNISGGLFGILSEILIKNGVYKKVLPIALRDLYPSVVGSQKFLREYYQIGHNAVAAAAREAIFAVTKGKIYNA